MGRCQTEQPLFGEEAVGPSEGGFLVARHASAATAAVQQAAESHPSPSVQVFVERPATAEPPPWRPRRGGSFFTGAHSVRSAYRDKYAPADRNFNVGFRVARTYD